MRIAAGLVVVIASIVAVSSMGSAAEGTEKGVSGPADCHSSDKAPVFGSKGSEVSISVSGRITCGSFDNRLEVRLYIWERQRQTGKWVVAGSSRGGSINSRVARAGASIWCVPSKVVNHFQVSMRSEVGHLEPKVIPRYPVQRVSRKVACPS